MSYGSATIRTYVRQAGSRFRARSRECSRRGPRRLVGADALGPPAGAARGAERLEAEVLRCVGGWDAARAWASDGACNPVAWLAYRAPVTKSDAVRLVRGARL